MTEDGIRTIRNFVIVTVLRVAGLAVVLFATFGLFIPWLIDAHKDADLWLAILLGVVVLGILGVVGLQLFLDFQRFPAKFHQAEAGPKHEQARLDH